MSEAAPQTSSSISEELEDEEKEGRHHSADHKPEKVSKFVARARLLERNALLEAELAGMCAHESTAAEALRAVSEKLESIRTQLGSANSARLSVARLNAHIATLEREKAADKARIAQLTARVESLTAQLNKERKARLAAECKQRIAAGQQGAAAAIYASNPSTSAPNEPVRKAAKHKQPTGNSLPAASPPPLSRPLPPPKTGSSVTNASPASAPPQPLPARTAYPPPGAPIAAKPYRCFVCRGRAAPQFDDQFALISHLRRHAPHADRPPLPYCSLCDIKCTGVGPFLLHLAGSAHAEKLRVAGAVMTSGSQEDIRQHVCLYGPTGVVPFASTVAAPVASPLPTSATLGVRGIEAAVSTPENAASADTTPTPPSTSKIAAQTLPPPTSSPPAAPRPSSTAAPAPASGDAASESSHTSEPGTGAPVRKYTSAFLRSLAAGDRAVPNYGSAASAVPVAGVVSVASLLPQPQAVLPTPASTSSAAGDGICSSTASASTALLSSLPGLLPPPPGLLPTADAPLLPPPTPPLVAAVAALQKALQGGSDLRAAQPDTAVPATLPRPSRTGAGGGGGDITADNTSVIPGLLDDPTLSSLLALLPSASQAASPRPAPVVVSAGGSSGSTPSGPLPTAPPLPSLPPPSVGEGSAFPSCDSDGNDNDDDEGAAAKGALGETAVSGKGVSVTPNTQPSASPPRATGCTTNPPPIPLLQHLIMSQSPPPLPLPPPAHSPSPAASPPPAGSHQDHQGGGSDDEAALAHPGCEASSPSLVRYYAGLRSSPAASQLSPPNFRGSSPPNSRVINSPTSSSKTVVIPPPPSPSILPLSSLPISSHSHKL